MPEGHTIHRTAGLLSSMFAGSELHVSSPQGRFAPGAALVDGRALTTVDAWGKHLFAAFDLPAGQPRHLHIHLGLYGKFAMGDGDAPPVRGALRARLEGGGHWADLRGPIVCEVITDEEKDAVTRLLGPDPLRRDADPDRAWKRLSRSGISVGQLLMDQKVLAGVGNVYRAELLFRGEVSPFRAGRDLTPDDWDSAWVDLVALMKRGVKAGRIVTTRPEDRARRSGVVTVADSHYVYRRTGLPCRRCGELVRTEVMAGRNLFWCARCQVS
jgi:endonuclease-8